MLFLVLAVLGVSYASSVRAWLQQRSDLNTLSAQVATSKARIASLEQFKRRWHDPAYIRTQARERFGWLMPGEIGYRVIDEHGHLISSGSQLAGPAVATAKASQEWWQRAWGSVVAAGDSSRPPGHAMPTPPSLIGKTPRYRAPVSLRPKLVLDTGAGVAGR